LYENTKKSLSKCFEKADLFLIPLFTGGSQGRGHLNTVENGNADDADLTDLHGYQNEILHGLEQRLIIFGWNRIAIHNWLNSWAWCL